MCCYWEVPCTVLRRPRRLYLLKSQIMRDHRRTCRASSRRPLEPLRPTLVSRKNWHGDRRAVQRFRDGPHSVDAAYPAWCTACTRHAPKAAAIRGNCLAPCIDKCIYYFATHACSARCRGSGMDPKRSGRREGGWYPSPCGAPRPPAQAPCQV